MCDRYSYRYGHICDDHFEQLVQLGPSADLEAFFEGELVPEHDEEATRAYYDTLFPSRQ
jgi:hypothetical protein